MSPNTPCRDQSEDLVRSWLLENAAVGARVVVRTLKDGLLGYEIAQIVAVERGKVKVGSLKRKADIGAFYFSGRSSVFRRSMRLVIPTKEVLQACEVCERNGGFLPGEPRSYICSF
jgi:hypothetical protein